MFQPTPTAGYTRFNKPNHAPMLKGSDIVGQPIITYGQYSGIASVSDVIFDHHTNQVLAFVADQPGWHRAARIIPWSGIQSVSPDSVIVWSKNMIVVAEQLYRIKQVLGRSNLTKGMPIITQDGRHLGIMTDIYFSQHIGTVIGYEVKGGLYADEVTNCGFVPAPPTLHVYQNAAYVPSHTARLMEERVQPVLIAPPSIHQTLGRRIHEPLRTDSGSLIAAPGQIVNDTVVALAQAYRKDHDLLRAVGLLPTSIK